MPDDKKMPPRLPDYFPPRPPETRPITQPSATQINDVSDRLTDRTQTVTLSGVNKPVPVVYGERRVNGVYLARPIITGTYLYLCIGWSMGEIDGVVEFYENDQPLPGGYTANHYTGTEGQGVDPLMATAIPGFDDAFPGVAYSVFRRAVSITPTWPRISALVRGRIVTDPRDTLSSWDKGQNPALAINDFVTNETFGPGLPVVGVEDCADYCDTVINGAPRSRFGITIADGAPIDDIMDLMTPYAECMWSKDGGEILLVPDAPVDTPAAVLTEDDIVENSLKMSTTSTLQSPTSVVSRYLPPSGGPAPWVENTVRQMLPEAATGVIDNIESAVDFNGVYRAEEATRKAGKRLRKLKYTGRYSWQGFDESVVYQRGDVIQLPDIFGLVSQLVRVTNISLVQPGLYQMQADHYDEEMYSDQILPGESGVVPVGAITMMSGSTVPSGWARYSDADGRFIRAAGGAYAIGATGGNNTITGFSGRTNTTGAHVGQESLPMIYEQVVAGTYPTYDRDAPFVEAGEHDHSYTVPDFNVDLYRRESGLIIKTGDAAPQLPPEAMILGQAGIIDDLRFRIQSFGGRFLSATAGNNANAGSNLPTSGQFNTGGAGDHLHITPTTSQYNVLPPSSGQQYAYRNEQRGLHTHTFRATVQHNLPRAGLAVYGATGEWFIRQGDVIMWAGDINTLPDGWALCDGTAGTMDLVDSFIKLDDGTPEAKNPGGFQYASVSFNTVSHNHQGDQVTDSDPNFDYVYTMYTPHRYDVSHTHNQITQSITYTPEFYALAFLQFVGV